ncbi:MAG: DUF1592 domain-containing protein [Deltaproteobacteria bacterium]|nr:DUF1592 domain-containing protein [Deltaproteobacteria bacterium]
MQFNSLSRAWLGLAVFGLWSACTGQVPRDVAGGPDDPNGLGGAGGTGAGAPAIGGAGSTPNACDTGAPPPAALRRLTPRQYASTVKSLLAVDVPLGDLLPEPKTFGFEGFAQNQVASVGLAEQWDAVAETVAAKASQDLNKLLGCDPNTDANCLRGFVQTLSERAFRRPLNAEQLGKHVSFVDAAKMTAGAQEAVRMYVAALLQSPSFLYQRESFVDDGRGHVRPDDWAMASRLSYLLWGDMPDANLFAAARAKSLGTESQVRAQAQRMLNDPRTRSQAKHFFEQWLEYDTLPGLSKDTATYPTFTPKLAELFRQQLERDVEFAMFEQKNTLSQLFLSGQTFMNAELAAFYGANAPSAAGFALVKWPAGERQGVLTSGGMMAAHGHPNQSSPIMRGKFMRERLLCQPLPSPPNDIEIMPPIVRPGATTRERFSDHKSDTRCASCHGLIDPVGFLFEHYDGMGAHRTKDQGLDVNASGELTSTEDLDGTYNSVMPLLPKLAASREVTSCVATQWFRFTFGREAGESDACAVAKLTQSLQGTGGDFKQLLVELSVQLLATKGVAQ